MPKGGNMELANRGGMAGGLCPDCNVDQYDMMNEEGRFFAICPTCGKRGPQAGSLYEATAGWKQMFGVPAKTMSRMVWMIAGGLCLLGVVIAVVGLMMD